MTIIWAIVILGALGIIFGLILAVAAKVFEVEVDPRLPEIQACLAGANCGGCGYPGCGGCAEAILAGKAPVTACAPAGPENAAKIAAIMGMEAPSGEKMVAHVLCNGGCNAKDNFEYRGVHDCLAATKVPRHVSSTPSTSSTVWPSSTRRSARTAAPAARPAPTS